MWYVIWSSHIPTMHGSRKSALSGSASSILERAKGQLQGKRYGVMTRSAGSLNRGTSNKDPEEDDLNVSKIWYFLEKFYTMLIFKCFVLFTVCMNHDLESTCWVVLISYNTQYSYLLLSGCWWFGSPTSTFFVSTQYKKGSVTHN